MLNYKVEDATKKLTIARSLDRYTPPFKIIGEYKLIDNGIIPEATVHIEANCEIIHEASNGKGPVHALGIVLRKALLPLCPEIRNVRVVD
jgi:2-isopropylmalate synthase